MRRGFQTALLVVLVAVCGTRISAELSDSAIRDLLMQQSISAYPGNCPCPYSSDARGRRCGARSAHSKQGGYAPLCYPEDVTAEMIAAYRAKLKN